MLSQARVKIVMNDHVLKKLEEKIIIYTDWTGSSPSPSH